jgi:toxin ParE1/3/4
VRVRWTRRARNDVVEIFEHIIKENRLAAAREYMRIREAAEGLADFPFSGRAVPEFPHPGIRQKIVRPYRIVYLVAEDASEVQLLTVLHTRQQWPPTMDGGNDEGVEREDDEPGDEPE